MSKSSSSSTPEMSPSPSPLPQATTLEDVANKLERILKTTKSSPTPEKDGFVLVKEDAGLLETVIAQIREFKQQYQPQEKPRSFLSRLSFGFFTGGKKTRKNLGKNKTHRNKNKTRRNKSSRSNKYHAQLNKLKRLEKKRCK